MIGLLPLSTYMFNKGTLDVGLHQVGEVVHFSEEDHPAIIGSVVLADFLEGVVALFGAGDWHVLFEVVAIGGWHSFETSVLVTYFI